VPGARYRPASVTEPQPKSLVLILARELASNSATPMAIIDADGTLVFFNEPAEGIVGQPFAQVGEIPAAEWGARLAFEDFDGNRLLRRAIPPGVAFFEQRPAHQAVQITRADGTKRRLAITAFPLFAKADEFAGAVAIFWEHPRQTGE
jgi:PAS domain-containing protein